MKKILTGGNLTQIELIYIKCRKRLNRGALNGILSMG
jgi:hypothetical protein